MALVLTEEQTMIRDSAEGFFADAAPVAQLRSLRDAKDADGFSRDVWSRIAEMGFAGVAIPEDMGGAGLGWVAAGLIQEAIGRNLSVTPFLSSSVLAPAVLRHATGDAREVLRGIASGSTLVALAAEERPRHAPTHIATRAEPSGNGFKLSGAKTHVLDGHVADKLIVAARTGGAENEAGGITLFLVDAKAAGVSAERRIAVDSRNTAHLKLDGVQVDGADVIGAVGEGWPILEAALDVGRACLAAELLGVSSQSFATTVDYLKQREQFGGKIGTFQALQHRAAHLFCEIELARSVTLRALQALDAGDPRAKVFASLAKAKAGQVGQLATNEAVQMHGGIGMTDEYDIGFFMKRARAAGETFGDHAFHGDRIARLMNY